MLFFLLKKVIITGCKNNIYLQKDEPNLAEKTSLIAGKKEDINWSILKRRMLLREFCLAGEEEIYGIINKIIYLTFKR